MGRKTTYGEQIKAKINGFRNYILVAEKDQIEALVEKDPKYFYNILLNTLLKVILQILYCKIISTFL